MWFFIISVTLTTLFVWDYFFKRHRNCLINEAGILGPKYTMPLIGNALYFIGNNATNVFSTIERLGFLYGKVCRLWIGRSLLLVVKDPKYFQVILNSTDVIKKIFLYDMLSCWLGDGMVLSFGSKWQVRRKMITPTYHFKILNEFVEIFDRQSGVLVEKLLIYADGKAAIDISPEICLMALDIIAETAMGVKINAQEHPDFPYAKAVTTATNIIAARCLKPLQFYKLGFILTAFPSYLKLKKSIKIMHKFTNKVIFDKIAALKRNIELPNSKSNSSNGAYQKKRLAFLDHLLQVQIDGKPLKFEEIREEVDTFMFGGHDTVTSAISFCLYLLARHADIQQKVFEEIVQVIGDDNGKPVMMRDLNDLKYLELVVRESLRLYPTAPMMGRYTEQDIQVDDKIIPAHTNILLLIYAAARDPDYFHNPNDFIPERYNDELPDKTASYANVPFSAGPRNCIGQKFAMLEMKSTISKIIRHFELLPLGPDVVPALHLVLRSSTGIQLGLKTRQY